MGRTLEGVVEWVVWYTGCAVAMAVGCLGMTQAGDADPMMRAPFAAMVAIGLACLFPIAGDLSLLGFVLCNGIVLVCWLGGSCVVDDIVDRSAWLRDSKWARGTLQTVISALSVVQVSLNSNLASTEAQNARLVLRGCIAVALALVAWTFRATCRANLAAGEAPALGGETGPPVSVDVTVVRSADLAAVSATALLLAAGVATAIDATNGTNGSPGHCRDYVTTLVLAMSFAFVTVFYLVMGVAALRARAGRPSVTCTYTLWRGLIPVMGDECVVSAPRL
jgi:hypothetical protein